MRQEGRGRAFRTEGQHLQRPAGKPATGFLVWVGVLEHCPLLTGPVPGGTVTWRFLSHSPQGQGQGHHTCSPVAPNISDSSDMSGPRPA